MKKILLIIIISSILSACSNNNQNIENNNDLQENENIKVETNVPTYIDNNPIKVGLYENKSLIKKYKTKLASHKDIASFQVYYTNKETLDSTNIKNNWNKYYNEYNDIDKYKIGFYITFTADNKQIEQMVLDPTSKHAMTPYLFVYLYDDIHQKDGAWYSHLEPENMKENTILSSIKLYLAGGGPKITSPISLTVFTYDEDDFDELGKYRGNSSYTIEIETK